MRIAFQRHLRRNAVAYLALFIALGGTSFAAATVITGKNVKDGSLTGKDVKNSSLTGTDVKDKSLNAADFNGSVAGPAGPAGLKGDSGATGPKGDKGDKGDNGTDATINGVAAGGDLSGTYPNPSIDDEAITPAKLAPGMQEATVLDLPRDTPVDDPSGIGPTTGPIRFKVWCLSDTMVIVLQHFAAGNADVHGMYVRGTNTVKRFDHPALPSSINGDFIYTSTDAGGDPGNDSGTGTFIATMGGSTVSGTFSYLADGTHCRLTSAMQLMQ